MSDFRNYVEQLHEQGDLLRVARTVNPQFELGALLKQAEERGKAILFQSVEGSVFPVVGGVLTGPARFCQALGKPDWADADQAAHKELVMAALSVPLAQQPVSEAPCKHTVLTGADIDMTALPIPTFFEGDTGPFLTAAVGIARNPANAVQNAGFYRVLVIDDRTLGLSVSPASDLHGFIRAAGERGATIPVALAIGAEPAVYMGAASKPPAHVSELDVAGALQGKPVGVVQAESSDLLVPASAEFVIELEVNPQQTVPNTMGEFGDLYGEQQAFVSRVTAITHRHSPVFHVLMAGAGREHNNIGLIILYGVEDDLRRELSVGFPEIQDVRVLFDPPSMSSRGDAFISVSGGRKLRGEGLIEHIYGLVCGGYPLSRMLRRVVLVDDDIDLDSPVERNWAIAARASLASDYSLMETSGGPVRIGIDARAREGEERLIIPGSDSINLDDYLD